MESIFVLTHTDESGNALTRGSLETVAAAKELADKLSAPLAIGILGANNAAVVTSIAGAAAPIFAVSGEAFAQARYATDAVACEALCRVAQPTIVLAPGSSRFARVTAGVAHRLDGVVDTHITSLPTENGLHASRWFYRQRVEAMLTRVKRPWFLLLEPGIRAPFTGENASPSIEEVNVELPATRTAVTGFRVPAQDAQTIRPDAKLLFVAGAGWTKKQPDGQVRAGEAGTLILNFLRKSGASLGSSKSLVDQGSDGQAVLPFLSHMNQVGQTGATPRHVKGLSTCCHGEEPHVVGWRFINERRAISLDPNCGWTRGKADVVYIADAFKVLAKLNEALEEKQS